MMELLFAVLSGRRSACWLVALLAAVVFPATARAQDPVQELKRILLTRPFVDPLLPAEKQQQELKKFYEDREQKATNIIDTRLRTFGALRQALMLKEWGDVPKTGREDPEVISGDARMRYRVAERFRNKVRTVIDRGDNDAKAAVANLITEMGLTIRAAINPDNAAKAENLERERRSGFARSMTDEMIRLADADSEFVRLHALRALAGINADAKRAASVFASKLNGANDVKVRRVAADGLLRLVSIANYLKEQTLKSPEVYATDGDVLEAGGQVVRHVPVGLNDPDGLVRAHCAEALRASAQVLALLFQRPQEERKNLAPVSRSYSQGEVNAIKEMLKAFDAAGPSVAATLTDPTPEVRLALVQTLERLSDARFRLAEDPLAVGAFGKVQARVSLVPPEASDPLSVFARGRWRAVAHLLTDPDARVRRSAVAFLEFFPEARPAVTSDLTKALCDPDRFVRWGAARALGNFSKDYQPKDAVAAVPTLGKLLFDEDVNVRLAAATTLESLGAYAVAALPEVTRAVHYADPDNRVAALYVMQSIGPEQSTAAIPSVTEALENPNPKVRRAAAETIGRYGSLAHNKTTVDALRRALGDDDQETRINASEALLHVLDAGVLDRK